MVAGEVSRFTGNADGPSESVQDNTGWLHLAQNRETWKQFCEMRKESCIDGPGCLEDPCASGMTGTDAGAAWLTRKRNTRYPSICIKPIVTLLRCPHGAVLVMAGRVRMAAGMDVDVATGVEIPRTYGSARRAEWFFGEVVRKC